MIKPERDGNTRKIALIMKLCFVARVLAHRQTTVTLLALNI